MTMSAEMMLKWKGPSGTSSLFACVRDQRYAHGRRAREQSATGEVAPGPPARANRTLYPIW